MRMTLASCFCLIPTMLQADDLTLKWWLPSMHDRLENDILQRVEQLPGVAPPSAAMLIDDQWIVQSFAGQVVGIEIETGRRFWLYPWDEPTGLEVGGVDENRLAVLNFIGDDRAASTSTDGAHLYVIDRRPNAQLTSARRGSLVALSSAEQGKLQWKIGGIHGDYEPALRETWPLGAPRIVNDQRLMLISNNGQIKLVWLNKGSGKLEKQLVVAASGGHQRAFDRFTPVLCGNHIVCPLPNLRLVGISQDKVAWTYEVGKRFVSKQPVAWWIDTTAQRPRQVVGARRGRRDLLTVAAPRPMREGQYLPRYRHLQAIGDRVVQAGIGIVCLDSNNGEHQWSVETKLPVNLFVRHDDTLLVNIDQNIKLLRSEDGSEVWSQSLDDNEYVTGNGVIVNDKLLCSIGTHEIRELDLSSGKTTRTFLIKHEVGNLLASHDDLFVQSFTRLAKYDLP